MTASIIPFDASNPATFLAQGEITPSRLIALLNTALFEATVDSDGDVYVSDGLEFPVWVKVLTDERMLQIFTHASAEDGQDAPTFAIVNEMNSRIVLPQFCLLDDKVFGTYWVTYDGGLPIKPFVRVLRRFSGAFVAGMRFTEKRQETSI